MLSLRRAEPFDIARQHCKSRQFGAGNRAACLDAVAASYHADAHFRGRGTVRNLWFGGVTTESRGAAAPFTSVPVPVIMHMLGFVDGEPRTLAALLQTCRFLYANTLAAVGNLRLTISAAVALGRRWESLPASLPPRMVYDPMSPPRHLVLDLSGPQPHSQGTDAVPGTHRGQLFHAAEHAMLRALRGPGQTPLNAAPFGTLEVRFGPASGPFCRHIAHSQHLTFGVDMDIISGRLRALCLTGRGVHANGYIFSGTIARTRATTQFETHMPPTRLDSKTTTERFDRPIRTILRHISPFQHVPSRARIAALRLEIASEDYAGSSSADSTIEYNAEACRGQYWRIQTRLRAAPAMLRKVARVYPGAVADTLLGGLADWHILDAMQRQIHISLLDIWTPSEAGSWERRTLVWRQLPRGCNFEKKIMRKRSISRTVNRIDR